MVWRPDSCQLRVWETNWHATGRVVGLCLTTTGSCPFMGLVSQTWVWVGFRLEGPCLSMIRMTLLVRHDACGLCFSDTKVIRAGQDHPRVHKDMGSDPVVLGHEVCMTVVGVGDSLRELYQPGDRFVVQPDIYVNGVGVAYGYEICGGLSQYSRIDRRVLCGDDGSYLVPVRPDTGYAEAALVEPWACVSAAYRLQYRTALKDGGTTWIIGTSPVEADRPFVISAGFDEASYPRRLFLTNVPSRFRRWLIEKSAALGCEIQDATDLESPPLSPVDDIIVLGADPETIETASPHLAAHGVFAIMAHRPLRRKVRVDVGRIHYDRLLYVGGRSSDIAAAYGGVPVQPALRPGGTTWFVGAAGPMGRMHVQRALHGSSGPSTILCTSLRERRLCAVRSAFEAQAQAQGVALTCVSREIEKEYRRRVEDADDLACDNIVVLAAAPDAVAEAAEHLAPGGTMNVFAGLPRGSLIPLDLSDVYLNDVRIIGHSGLTTDDMRLMLQEMEEGSLSTARSVVAVGSLDAAHEGLRAVAEATLSGKVIIYPNIRTFPITSTADLRDRLPTVYARLRGGAEWTTDAEAAFLEALL